MTVADPSIFEPDGRAIRHVVDGEGDGPVLVLLPGRGLDITYLGTLAMVLEEEGFRVVRVGSRRTAAATMHDLAQDVIDVLDHLGFDAAWIGGHGFGGTIARTVALDHDDRVNGVLLLTVDGASAENDDVSGALPQDAEIAGMQAAALAATPEAEWATVAPNHPILIIQGADDPIAPPVNGEQLRATAPHLVSLTTIEGAGHLFVSTHAGETGFLIEDYLGMD
nr:alpha/beta hydrolase [Microbacterium aquimaris]